MLICDTQIVIIEAKVRECYDTKQLEEFKKDKEFLLKPELFGGACPSDVFLIGLHSSHYSPKENTKEFFTEKRYITWEEISGLFDKNTKEGRDMINVFIRANDIKREEKIAKEVPRIKPD